MAALILLSACAAHAASPADYDMSAPESLAPEQLYAEAALLIDEDTGEVLLSKNARVRMYPASTTKMMTLLLGLESGIGLDEAVTIPKEAAEVPSDSSLIPVKPGDEMTFRDLLYGFMLSSGNDGANAVAVLADGSLDAFVEHMNQRAAQIGCEGTHFANPSGYHDDNHYTTAKDLALIAREAMQNADFRAIVAAATWDITVTRGGETRTGTIVSRNSLLQSDLKYYYPECTGIKTGHHRRAGWCFVGSAERDGMRVICVVMNCEGEMDKWYDAARLFEYGFTRYEKTPLSRLLERAKGSFDTVQVANAAADDPDGGRLALDVQLDEDIYVPIVRDSETALNAITDGIAETAQVDWTREPVAPIAEGETLGTLRCALPNGQVVTASLVATRAVAEAAAVTAAPTEAPAVPEDVTPAQPKKPSPVIWIVLAALLLMLCAAIAGAAQANARKRRRRRRRR